MKVILTGGGTGGHIYPALALGRYIRSVDPDTEILFIGAKGGLEEQIIPPTGFAMETLHVKGIPRRLTPEVLRSFSLLFASLRKASRIIKQFNPDFVVGTGGFAAAPAIMAALLKRKKVFLHEQNVIPGVTNRLLAPFASRVCLSFEGAARYFIRRSNLVTTGNPRASETGRFEKSAAREILGLDPLMPLLLVVGGSRGAGKLNQCMIDFLGLPSVMERMQIIYVTGTVYFDEVTASLQKHGLPDKYRSRLNVTPFQEEMPLCMAAADLIITRAGATTLAEILAMGLPAIIIPSPNVVHNHQLLNARELQLKGAAEMIEEKDLSGKKLQEIVLALLNNPEKMTLLKENCKKLAYPNAAEQVYQLMLADSGQRLKAIKN